ncbi:MULTISPECIES: hypothetical protein, partial [unclassified Marinobacter]
PDSVITLYDASNPAGRLHDILQEAAKKKDGNITAQRVWASVFKVEPDDIQTIMAKLFEVHELVSEVRRLIESDPDLNHELLLRYFPRIESAIFSKGIATPWKPVGTQLDAAVLDSLKYCADALKDSFTEDPVNQDELEGIDQTLLSLEGMIKVSSLPQNLRVALLEEISKIRKSISMVQIKGVRGIKEAMQSLVGAVIAHQEELKAQREEDRQLLARLAETMVQLDKIISKSLRMYRLFRHPVQFLISKVNEDAEASDEIEVAIDE